jgi:hypothetical protein
MWVESSLGNGSIFYLALPDGGAKMAVDTVGGGQQAKRLPVESLWTCVAHETGIALHDRARFRAYLTSPDGNSNKPASVISRSLDIVGDHAGRVRSSCRMLY